MTKKEKELIIKLIPLFTDKVMGEIKDKFENEKEVDGAWILKEYQFKKARPILQRLLK